MTTPGGWTSPGSFVIPANGPGGLSGHAAMTEADWKAAIEGQHRPHWEGLGDPVEVLRELQHAVVSALTGDFGPFADLVGEVPVLGSFVDLAAALRGEYSGDDPVLIQIQSWAGGLGGLVGAMLGGLPDLWPIGSATDEIVNILWNPSFEGAVSVDGDETWFWDEAMGRTAAGSVYTDADGTERVLLSERHEVRQGQKLRAGGHVRWDGVSAGAGECFAVRVAAFDVDEVLVSSTTVGAVSDMAWESSGGSWVQMEGDWTVPAGVRYVRVQIVVTSAVTAGRAHFDDMLLAHVGRMPQRMVDGLEAALTALGDWLETLVDQLLGALGLPALGGLFDKITDLSDEIDAWRGDTELKAGQLADLIGDLLADPASRLGALPQSLVSGLTSALAGKASGAALASVEDFVNELIGAILQALRGIPVVGGTLADIIADLGGLKSTAVGAQLTADAVGAGIVEGWTGGSTSGVDLDVYDTMGAIRALVGGDGYTRVNITSTTTWTKPVGTTEVIVVGIAAGQNGQPGGTRGGNGGLGGGHLVQALDPGGFTSLYIEVGVNATPTRFRRNGAGGAILAEAISGSSGGMATQFGYAPSSSSAAGGGGGGSHTAAEGGGGGTGVGGGANGTYGGNSSNGGSGGSSAAAGGGSPGTSAGAGGAAPLAGIPCGGGGGAGGQGGSGAFFESHNGRPGGAGGFPGGGGGGGGGRSGLSAGNAGGSGGPGAAGLGIIFHR